ncbi:MAG TPA: hypothetical protein VM451_06255 [Candidatus Limnocylindria bacterium]|nr:hypothetical protein [Candidatus Limnocylindria bacterium]
MTGTRDQRAGNAAYYAANRQREIDRVRRRQNATVAFLRRLREVPCADCGGRFQPIQMDFDHRDPATKAFTICSGPASLKSREVLSAEVAKCDVVCANCHRLRSRARHRQWLATRTQSQAPRIEEYRRRWRRNAEILDQLRSVPCADCGARFAQCSMDFDHPDPSQKLRSVTRLVNGSLDVLLAEASKCDIVCANCHRVRTFHRRSRAA